MRTTFSNCPIQDNNSKMQNLSEEGLAFLSDKKHQIVYATTTQPISSRRHSFCNTQIILCVLLASLFATGLIALEIYRSTEIVRLRQDTDQLRADFEDLKHRLLEDDLLEEIKAFEKQSYAEEEAAKKLTTTTMKTIKDDVAKDDEFSYDGDEEDYYDNDTDNDDDDNNNSNEYYENNETTNNKEEENTTDDDKNERSKRSIELPDPVVALPPTAHHHRPLILGRTEDGVPVLSHSYAAMKELNRTGTLTNLRLYDTLDKRTDDTNTEDPIKPHHRISSSWPIPKKWKKQGDTKPHHKRNRPDTVVPITVAPLPVIQRHSRVMQTPSEGEQISTQFAKDEIKNRQIVMRVVQPSTNSNEHQAREMHPGAIVHRSGGPTLRSHDPSNPIGDAVKGRKDRRRKHPRQHMRNRSGNMELETENTVPPRRLAAHFSANSTMYVMGHPHYAGNGRLRHPGIFTDWAASPWVRELGMDNHFVLNDGIVTVRQPGLYYTYAQIYYIDDHDTNGYNFYVNGAVRFQCITMTHSSSAVTKVNTCYTGGVLYLRTGDTLYLRDVSGLRYSLFEPDKSFFGLFRLGDARIR